MATKHLESYFKFRSAENPNLKFMDFAPKTYVTSGHFSPPRTEDFIDHMKFNFMSYAYRRFVKSANQIEFIFMCDEITGEYFYCAAEKKTGNVLHTVKVSPTGSVRR